MQWLTPITGAILAACVIPPLLLLYFLKLRRRQQPMACTILWQRSVEDLRANAPFQRLRFNLLLLLQFLALVLLAISVMQPQILGGDQGGGRTIMLLDRSASMEATDVDGGDEGNTRLDAAKEAMRDRIETLYGGGFLERRNQGETMVIAFDDRAEVIARFTGSKGELLDAIDRVEGTHGGSSLEEALKLARAYATNVDPDSQRQVGPAAALELFSDGRIQDLGEQVLQRGEALVYYPIGDETTGNVSLGALDVKRPYDKPGSVEVFCALLNHGTEPVRCEVQLAVDGNARAVEDVDLPAAEVDPASGAIVPGRNNLVFTPFPQPRSAVIEVANLRPDALAADNAAQVVVPPPKRLRVALLPPESGYLKEALQGMSLESLTLLTPAVFESKAASGGLDAYDVIVLDDWVPEGTLPPGRYLIFGKAPNVPGFNPFGMSGPQLVLNARTEHPALRFVVLDDLRAFEAQLVEPSEEVETIVEGSSGPLVMALSRGSLQIEYVAFPSTRSNWPILRSWIPFVFNSVEHLGTLGEGVTSRTWTVGEAFSSRLPADAEGITLALPDGTERKLDVADPTALTWGPIRRVGLYRVNWTAGDVADERPFAVNLDGEREGNIAAVPVLSVGQSTVEGVDPEASSYTPLWPWAIGLCLFVLMLEWWVYHRKSYV